MAPRDPRLRPALDVSWPGDADPAAPVRLSSGWDLRLVLFGEDPISGESLEIKPPPDLTGRT